ncbi:thiamine phosphate synthase [Salibacterium lacus]|uniref:Thiamine-phosphate synthase n=1 Tax=Salibacterium lacus TaxID=1898109 RepID=A0ABW5T339_9BACI
MNKEQYLLYFIMGSNNTDKNPEDALHEAVKGGVTCFQFREKGQDAAEGTAKKELGGRLRKICRKAGIPFIVNDDVDLAMELEADGIHAGQEDTPLVDIKKQCPSSMTVGVSAKTVDEAEQAVQDGADYLGVGPMFATSTKEDAETPVGPGAIRMLRESGLSIPIVGIGGIDTDNAESVMEAGADGVSVISAVSRADDIQQAAGKLREVLR